jgi:hypothetical protein
MVITTHQLTARCRPSGFLTSDLLVAIALLCLAVIPLAMSFAQERRALLASYQRAIAMEIVDGEMELLAAGNWRSYSNGTHQFTSRANAATNLPPGKLQLTVAAKHFILEWRPDEAAQGGIVRREITLK